MKVGNRYKLTVTLRGEDFTSIYRLAEITKRGLFVFMKPGNKAWCFDAWELRKLIAEKRLVKA